MKHDNDLLKNQLHHTDPMLIMGSQQCPIDLDCGVTAVKATGTASSLKKPPTLKQTLGCYRVTTYPIKHKEIDF